MFYKRFWLRVVIWLKKHYSSISWLSAMAIVFLAIASFFNTYISNNLLIPILLAPVVPCFTSWWYHTREMRRLRKQFDKNIVMHCVSEYKPNNMFKKYDVGIRTTLLFISLPVIFVNNLLMSVSDTKLVFVGSLFIISTSVFLLIITWYKEYRLWRLNKWLKEMYKSKGRYRLKRISLHKKIKVNEIEGK